MAAERLSSLRQRHNELYRQLETVRQETDADAAGLDREAVERVSDALQRECDALKRELETLLDGQSVRAIESEEIVADANSVLSRLLAKTRAIYFAVYDLKRKG